MSLSTIRVPAIVASSLICLAAGAAGGVIAMTSFGYHWDKMPGERDSVNNPPPTPGGFIEGGAPGGPGPGGPGGPGGMAGGMGKMGGGMGKMGGGMRPQSKTQLATLVTKLNQLTEKPLTIELTKDQKAKVQELIKGLAEAEELAEDDAKKRLDALLEVLKESKATFEAAGYRWPGGQGGGGMMGGMPSTPPNPFKEGAPSEHLKSLEARLKKAA